jgi:glycosyltransferase involved in cell wall biosynthesis
MRITYVARSFLDYRIPVFEKLSRLTDDNLTAIFSENFVPERVQKRLRAAIGDKAIGLTGELAIGFHGNITSEFSNTRLRIPWQPGILKEIRISEPDVLIGDGFSQWTLPVLVYRMVKRIPLVICYERTAHTERNAQWYRRIYRKAVLPFVDAMCVNGSLSKKYAKSLGMPEKQITTGNMVADVAELSSNFQCPNENHQMDMRKNLNIPIDSTVFISVSKLVKLKGIAEFLESWKKLKSNHQANPHLLIVGDGPERENLESICRTTKLTNITFAGAIDYEDIPKYYAAADVFIISTLEDNWSLVVPEAMSCQLSIMCSKYNGCWPELVSEKNGWVFDPLSVTDTVACLEKCLAARKKLPDMGNQSFAIVRRHTPEHAAIAILDACKIALGNKNAKY